MVAPSNALAALHPNARAWKAGERAGNRQGTASYPACELPQACMPARLLCPWSSVAAALLLARLLCIALLECDETRGHVHCHAGTVQLVIRSSEFWHLQQSDMALTCSVDCRAQLRQPVPAPPRPPACAFFISWKELEGCFGPRSMSPSPYWGSGCAASRGGRRAGWKLHSKGKHRAATNCARGQPPNLGCLPADSPPCQLRERQA